LLVLFILTVIPEIISSTIPGFLKNDNSGAVVTDPYTNDKISLADIYQSILNKEQEIIQEYVDGLYKDNDYENIQIVYKTMNSNGDWVEAGINNNIKQILSMGSMIFFDQLKEDGTFSWGTYKKYIKYCEELATNSISYNLNGEKTTYCEDDLEDCTNKKNKKCQGHKSVSLEVKMYSFIYSDDDPLMANNRQKTLFDIDNTIKIYNTYLSNEEKNKLSGSFWNDNYRSAAIGRCIIDWEKAYGIDTAQYKFDSDEIIQKNIDIETTKIFDTDTINKEKVLHITNVKEKENKIELVSDNYNDKYVNKIQYTLVKWALSRNGTSVYSQANRTMKKNPTKSASTDCSGFVSWVMSKTIDELNFKKADAIHPELWDGLGFDDKGNLKKYPYTTDTFKEKVNITNPDLLIPGDVLVRRKNGYASDGKRTGNNHVGIFLGYTSNGYQYIDCTSNKGGPAIQVKTINHKKPVNSGAEGDSLSGTWYGAVRLFNYEKLNNITTDNEEKESNKFCYTTDSILEKLTELKITKTPDEEKKKIVNGRKYYKWRKYKKYGEKTIKWKINLK